MKLKEYTVHFSGAVQGVNFRYTAVQFSRKFQGLTGYVKNVQGGGVEVVAECDRKVFDEFLKAVQSSYLGSGISEVEIQEREINDRNYSVFDIHF